MLIECTLLMQVIGTPHTPRPPPWFLLLPSYWRRDQGKGETIDRTPQEGAGNGPAMAVKVRGLSKVFYGSPGLGGTRVALDSVDLDLHAGRVMAILGHNGAGEWGMLGDG